MEQMQYTITNPFLPISRKIGSGSPATARMGETYCLLTYNGKEKKFETILKEEINGNTSQGIRGIYIEDTLYVISGNIIEAYDMDTGKKTGDIIL